jgi:hypothetical protein
MYAADVIVFEIVVKMGVEMIVEMVAEMVAEVAELSECDMCEDGVLYADVGIVTFTVTKIGGGAPAVSFAGSSHALRDCLP